MPVVTSACLQGAFNKKQAIISKEHLIAHKKRGRPKCTSAHGLVRRRANRGLDLWGQCSLGETGPIKARPVQHFGQDIGIPQIQGFDPKGRPNRRMKGFKYALLNRLMG